MHNIINIKNILPKKLKSIPVELCQYGNASFNAGRILLNREGLIQNIQLKKAIEKYLHTNLTETKYLKAIILHEYGHALRMVTGKFDSYKFRQDKYYVDLFQGDYIDRQLHYWKYIKEEKEAWKFAKKYLKKSP